MFASYRSLLSIIEGTAGERAKLFTSLCGISAISRLDTILREQISADNAICGEFSEQDLDRETRLWIEQRSAMNDLATEYNEKAHELLSKQEFETAVDDLKTLKEIVKMIEDARRDRDQAADRQRKQMSKIEAKEELIKSLRNKLSLEEQSLEASQAQEPKAQKSLDDFQARKTAHEAFTEAVRQMAIPAPDKPKPVSFAKTLHEYIEEQVEIKTEGQKVADDLELIKKSGKGVCETCGAAIDVSPKRVATLEQRRVKLRNDYKQLSATIEAIKAAEKSQEDYKKAYTEWDTARQLAKAAAEANRELANQYVPTVTLKDLTEKRDRIRDSIKSARENIKKLRTQLEDEQRDLNDTQSRHTQDSEVIAKAQAVLEQYEMPKQKDIEAMEALVETQTNLRNDLRDLKVQLREKRSSTIQTVQRVRSLRAKRRRIATLAKCVERQREGRAYCSKERLPSAVVTNMLSDTTDRVNALLMKLSAKFMVRPLPGEFHVCCDTR